jgi:DNA primase
MQHSAKYLIHADIRTSGVVERSDVVGAIFGQTEGLLGTELDLRELQESSKIGRIDVKISSEGGRSFGTVTIASALDRVETAVLAASLETIDQVGPSHAECTVAQIVDARAAKRREVVERATELLAEFEESAITGDTLIEEVRRQARVEELTEFENQPAGPRVGDSDALIVVEGRADVRQLLEYGIKNAIAVEGTDVPTAVAQLTRERTTTAFLDGDRGGDLILEELQQVGDIDHVAFAPAGQSVEDLDRAAIERALQKKLPFEQVAEGTTAREAFAPTDGGTIEPAAGVADAEPDAPDERTVEAETGETPAVETGDSTASPVEQQPGRASDAGADDATGETEQRAETVDERTAETADERTAETASERTEREPVTLADHVEQVVDTETVRLLDAGFDVLAEADADEAFEAIANSEETPHSVVVDGAVTQRILDIAAQRGVGQVVGTDTGEFVKQPTGVRVRTAAEFE